MKRTSPFLFFIWGMTVLVLALSGCVSDEQDELFEEFVQKTTAEQRVAIVEYPLEMQVKIYIMAMKRFHPPDLGLVYSLSQNGEEIVPILIQYLQDESMDKTKVDLLDVFLGMQQLGTYDVASDTKLMSFIEEQVLTIDHASSKKLAREMIEDIKRGERIRVE